MKKQTILIVDSDDAADLADVKALADAAGLAHNRLELPNPLAHFTKSIGQPITIEQLDRARNVLALARYPYERYAKRPPAESSPFVPIDVAKSTVAAIDAALEVVGRWTLTLNS